MCDSSDGNKNLTRMLQTAQDKNPCLFSDECRVSLRTEGGLGGCDNAQPSLHVVHSLMQVFMKCFRR